MAANRSFEIYSRQAQTRVSRVEWDLKRFRNFRHRMTGELAHHENCTALRLKSFKCPQDRLLPKMNIQDLVGQWARVSRLVGQSRFSKAITLLSIVKDEVEGHTEQPRTERSASVERVQSLHQVLEHLLRHVLEVGRADSESPKAIPDVGEVLTVHLSKRHPLWLRGGRWFEGNPHLAQSSSGNQNQDPISVRESPIPPRNRGID
jgi:hypothetical protein